MGTAALVKPTTCKSWLKRVLGSFTAGQDKYADGLILENAGDPTNAITPDYIGQLCVDTTNTHSYIAQTAASSGWARIDN